MLIWLPMFLREMAIPTAFWLLDWHIHEMLYGYLPAIITGFLLTAIPNWTGRLPLQGGPLAEIIRSGPITFVYPAHDELHNDAVVLRDILKR